MMIRVIDPTNEVVATVATVEMVTVDIKISSLIFLDFNRMFRSFYQSTCFVILHEVTM